MESNELRTTENVESFSITADLNASNAENTLLDATTYVTKEKAKLKRDSKGSSVSRKTACPSVQGRSYKSAVVTKVVMLNKFKELEADSESEEEENQEEEDDDRKWRGLTDSTDYSLEHMGIQNIVSYLRQGDVTVTILALCLLERTRLNDPVIQLAIKDTGGLEILLNLLETNDIKCQQGSLKVLFEISPNPFIRQKIVTLGGLRSMVSLLMEPSLELRCLLAKTIARVARCQKSVAIVRWWGGIPYLIELLDVSESILYAEKLTRMQKLELEGARCGALALWSLSRSCKNKRLIRYCGAVSLLARLVKCSNEEILVPVVGTLQECASLESFRLAIRVEGILDYFCQHLNTKNDQLQTLCASAIFKCAEDEGSRESIGKQGALVPLIEILADPNKRNNKELMAAIAGAIWKGALSLDNVKRMKELDAVIYLVNLLHTQPEDVLINAVGAIGLCARLPENSAAIRKAGGIELLVQLLTSTNEKLLVNVAHAVGACAEDPEGILVIEELDAIRLLWSHLKSTSPDVQASAAWALCPCIRNVKDSGHVVRSFVGGTETLVGLFKSQHTKVHAAICAVVCEVAKDEDNIGVMSDYGIVKCLSKLCDTKDIGLQHYLAGAIAACCPWRENCKEFGEEDIVPSLVGFLRSNDKNVQLTTAKALYQLSNEPTNCVKMHRSGVVRYLVKQIASGNEEIQEASAYCLKNIRTLAMATEQLIYV